MKKVSSTSRRLIRIASYLFVLTIFALASTLGLTRKQDTKYTLDYSLGNIAHADSPHTEDGGGDAGGDSADASGGGDDSPDGCFAKGTPVTMADGTTKPIEELALGDTTLGGVVTGVMQFQMPHDGDMYDHKGILVSGCHTLNDEGVWRYVSESPHSRPVEGPEDGVVYLVNTTNHRVYVNGIEFSDFSEVGDTEPVRARYLKDLIWYNQIKVWQRDGVSFKKVLTDLRHL